jgi:hypothetical protein
VPGDDPPQLARLGPAQYDGVGERRTTERSADVVHRIHEPSSRILVERFE